VYFGGIPAGRPEPLARAYVGVGWSATPQRAGAHERIPFARPRSAHARLVCAGFVPAFSVSTQPDVDFGWNVAGIILGALSEQLYYALSLALPPRATPA
jgi:hypothetical protein